MTDTWERDPNEVAEQIELTSAYLIAKSKSEADQGNREAALKNEVAAQMLRDLWERNAELRIHKERMERSAEACEQQARIHAQEARTANTTIGEIYQLCSGATGERGNWNGADPVRRVIAERDQLRADAATLYQVLGALLDETGRFDTDEGEAALDLASYLAGNRARPASADSILPFAAADEATAIAQETGQYGELAELMREAIEREQHRRKITEGGWITHDSRKTPADLAPAQLVDVEVHQPTSMRWTSTGWREFADGDDFARVRTDSVTWRPGLRYRPALSATGSWLCSADDLHPGAHYVAKDCDGVVFQYSRRPVFTEAGIWGVDDGFVTPATDAHRRPGPASESLMEVDRD